uniref:hypothetical protein n=1 Tax=Purpureocillium takamizusanense TaxID=2060973 RepID=UPI001FA6C359|nr:hypothetical protein MRV25_mgp18 [Purpureocillium takamizusanense]UNI92575.1 hypothetical protein [Purpureocillium takamizusanense]
MNKFDEFKHREALVRLHLSLGEESYSSPEAFLTFVQGFLNDLYPTIIDYSEETKLAFPELNYSKNLIVLHSYKEDGGYNYYPMLYCNLSKLVNKSMEDILISYPKYVESKELWIWIGLEREDHNFNSLLASYGKCFVDVTKNKISDIINHKSKMEFININYELYESCLENKESFVNKVQEILTDEYLSILIKFKNSPEFDMDNYTKDLIILCNCERREEIVNILDNPLECNTCVLTEESVAKLKEYYLFFNGTKQISLWISLEPINKFGI